MKLGAVYWITSAALCVVSIPGMLLGYAIDKSSYKTESSTEMFETVSELDIDVAGCKVEINVDDSMEQVKVEFIDFRKKHLPSVGYTTGKLSINTDKEKRMVGFANFHDTPSIKVTLPTDQLDTLSLDLDAVDSSNIRNLSIGSLDVDSDASVVEFDSVTILSDSAKFDIDAAELIVKKSSFKSADIEVDASVFEMSDTIINGAMTSVVNASKLDINDVGFKYSNFNISASAVDGKGLILEGDMKLDANASSVNIGINGNRSSYFVNTNSDASGVDVSGENDLNAEGPNWLIDIKSSASAVRVDFS